MRLLLWNLFGLKVFHGLRNHLKEMSKLLFFGKPTLYKGIFSISHPEIETIEAYKKSLVTAMQGVYPSTEKLSSKFLHSKGIAKLMHGLLEQVSKVIPETLS